jgi:hypothetical protein
MIVVQGFTFTFTFTAETQKAQRPAGDLWG